MSRFPQELQTFSCLLGQWNRLFPAVSKHKSQFTGTGLKALLIELTLFSSYISGGDKKCYFEIINCQAPAAMNKFKLFIYLMLAVFFLLSLTEETSAVVFSLSHGRIRVVKKHEKRKRNRSKNLTEENTRRQKKYHKQMKELERWIRRFALKEVS